MLNDLQLSPLIDLQSSGITWPMLTGTDQHNRQVGFAQCPAQHRLVFSWLDATSLQQRVRAGRSCCETVLGRHRENLRIYPIGRHVVAITPPVQVVCTAFSSSQLLGSIPGIGAVSIQFPFAIPNSRCLCQGVHGPVWQGTVRLALSGQQSLRRQPLLFHRLLQQGDTAAAAP